MLDEEMYNVMKETAVKYIDRGKGLREALDSFLFGPNSTTFAQLKNVNDFKNFSSIISKKMKSKQCMGIKKCVICLTCSKTRKACICLDCFFAGEHKDHIFYLSNKECFCDCGSRFLNCPICKNHTEFTEEDHVENEKKFGELFKTYKHLFSFILYLLRDDFLMSLRALNANVVHDIQLWIHSHLSIHSSITRLFIEQFDSQNFGSLIDLFMYLEDEGVNTEYLFFDLVCLHRNPYFNQNFLTKALSVINSKFDEVYKNRNAKNSEILGEIVSFYIFQNTCSEIIKAISKICSNFQKTVEEDVTCSFRFFCSCLDNFPRLYNAIDNDSKKKFIKLFASCFCNVETLKRFRRVIGDKDDLIVGDYESIYCFSRNSLHVLHYINSPKTLTDKIVKYFGYYLKKNIGSDFLMPSCILDGKTDISFLMNGHILFFEKLVHCELTIEKIFKKLKNVVNVDLEDIYIKITVPCLKIFLLDRYSNYRLFERFSDEKIFVTSRISKGSMFFDYFCPIFGLAHLCIGLSKHKEDLMKIVAKCFGVYESYKFDDENLEHYINFNFLHFVLSISLNRDCLRNDYLSLVTSEICSRLYDAPVSRKTVLGIIENSTIAEPEIIEIPHDIESLLLDFATYNNKTGNYELADKSGSKLYCPWATNTPFFISLTNSGSLPPIPQIPVELYNLDTFSVLDCSSTKALIVIEIISIAQKDKDYHFNSLHLCYTILSILRNKYGLSEEPKIKSIISFDRFEDLSRKILPNFSDFFFSIYNGKTLTEYLLMIPNFGPNILRKLCDLTVIKTDEKTVESMSQKMSDLKKEAKLRALRNIKANQEQFLQDAESVEMCPKNVKHICSICHEEGDLSYPFSVNIVNLNFDKYIENEYYVSSICMHPIHPNCVQYKYNSLYQCQIDKQFHNAVLPLVEINYLEEPHVLKSFDAVEWFNILSRKFTQDGTFNFLRLITDLVRMLDISYSYSKLSFTERQITCVGLLYVIFYWNFEKLAPKRSQINDPLTKIIYNVTDEVEFKIFNDIDEYHSYVVKNLRYVKLSLHELRCIEIFRFCVQTYQYSVDWSAILDKDYLYDSYDGLDINELSSDPYRFEFIKLPVNPVLLYQRYEIPVSTKKVKDFRFVDVVTKSIYKQIQDDARLVLLVSISPRSLGHFYFYRDNHFIKCETQPYPVSQLKENINMLNEELYRQLIVSFLSNVVY